MLKSKLLKNSNKDKDTNSLNVVNNKDTNVHSKSSLKKLLNGKTSGHNLLNLNNIKPVKPKGSLYELNNGLKDENYYKSEDENENDNVTLTSSSPKTLELSDITKDKVTSRIMENQDSNTINDTQSSPNLHWATSVAPNSGKGIASTTYDSMKTLTPSNYNSPISTTHLSVNTNLLNPTSNNQKASTKPSSPFLSPKSPLEAIARFSPFKSSENHTSLSLSNLNNKTSSSSLQTSVTAHSAESVNKITKKSSKKEKKEANGNSSGSGSSKRPTSLFLSLGRYFKNKSTDKTKEKESKKSKEKVEVNDSEFSEEQITREIGNLLENEEWKINLMNHFMKINNTNNTEEEIADVIKINSDVIKTPKPKEEDNNNLKPGSQDYETLKTPTPLQHEKLNNQQFSGENGSTSMQSVTLVENQPTKSEPSSVSSATTQPIPIETLKVIDQSIKVTSSPTSLPPLSASITSDVKESVSSTDEPLYLNGSVEEITVNIKEKEQNITMDKEGTYRQSYIKSDDNSFLDNEDTIIKKNSVISVNNNRLSVRDINICRELKMTSELEGSGNSLSIESTITDVKRQSTTSIPDDQRLTVKPLAENTETKYPVDYPKSPLGNVISVTISEEPNEEVNSIEKDNQESISDRSSYLDVKDESFDDSLEAVSLNEYSHNVLASSPHLSIPSPYNSSTISNPVNSRSQNHISEKNLNSFIPKAPSAIGLVTTPSNSTQATNMSEYPKVSLDAVSLALMEESNEERRCPICHCTIPPFFNPIPNIDTSMDNTSFEDNNSINSFSRNSSTSRLASSPKFSQLSPFDNINKYGTNGTIGTNASRNSHLSTSVTSSMSSKDYSRSISSMYTFSTVTSSATSEDCDCYCHEARYHHPEFHVYHTKQSSSRHSSKPSISGMSFNSYQSHYSNYSCYSESLNRIYDKRSFCSATSSLSRANSFFFSSNNKNIRRKDFSKSTREIGRGATCVVKLVHKINDPSMHFALKEYKITRVKQNIDERTFLKTLRNEYQIGSLLHHPNIIETYAFLMTKTHNHKRRKYYVLLEYCNGGDLFTTIQKGELGREEINCNFKQLMDGVSYLHSIGVAHCDIKPENILIKNVSQLKIIDFGTSEIFKYPYTPDTIKKLKGIKGSKPYIAPEQFQRSEYDPRASDIWSCAIVYIASYFDELPWRVASLEDFDFLRWKKERRNDLIRHLPDGPRQLIIQMLNPDPDKRITMEQIYENEWFASIKTCISGEVQCHDKKHYHVRPQETSAE